MKAALGDRISNALKDSAALKVGEGSVMIGLSIKELEAIRSAHSRVARISSQASQVGNQLLPLPSPVVFWQTDWPNPRGHQQPDRSFYATYNKNLIGQDKLPPGARLTDLPPLGPLSNLTLRGMVQGTPITLIPPPTPTVGSAEWIIRARRRGRR